MLSWALEGSISCDAVKFLYYDKLHAQNVAGYDLQLFHPHKNTKT